MAVPRRPAPVKEVDLEQTAELPVIDFTGTHAELSSGDATISVAALTMDESLARTDTYAVPSLAGATALADNLRDVEERLHRKSERVATLERDLEALRTDAEARLAALRASSDGELAKLRVEHAAALREARDAAAESARKLTQTAARLDETQERLTALETRAGQQVATLGGHEKELATRARRIEELQQEFTQASGLARELGQARDGLAARVQGLEQALAERSSAFDLRVSELAATQSRLAGSEGERARLRAERDELRACAGRQLEALHRLEGHRGVADALLAERDAELAARDAQIAALRVELRQLAERDERIVALEAQLAEARERLTQQDLRVSALSSDGRALQGRLEELNDALASADRSAQAQSEALRVAAGHAAEIEGQLASERERLASLGSELEAVRATAAAEREAARAAATTQLDGARREAASERDRLLAEAAAERATAHAAHDALRAQLAERDTQLTRRADEHAQLEADIATRERAIVERERAVTELLDDQQEQLARQGEELAAARETATRMEGDLRAAEEQLRHYESEHRHRETRAEDLARAAESLQTRLDETLRHLAERDEQIRRLEGDARASASVLGKLQQSIQRLSREDTGARPIVTEAPLETMARVLMRVDGGNEQTFTLGRRTTIGRTPDNDIRLDANFVSRHHAVVLASNKNTIIEDLNSTNGVVVNGRRVTRQTLQDGDVVNIGTSEFRFQLRPLGHAGEPG